MSGVPGRSGPPGNQHSHGGGAPALNANARTHGVYSYLSTGRLPEDAGDIESDLETLRTDLTSACNAVHGETTLPRAALIQSACRHEAVCRLLLRWLATGGLTGDQRITVLKDLSRATDKRDAAIKALDLDQPADAAGDRFAFLVPASPADGPGARNAAAAGRDPPQ